MKQNILPTTLLQDSISEKDFFNPFCHQASEDVDKSLTTILNELYGVNLARGIKFLLNNVDKKVQRRFSFTYLAPETLAFHVTSHIEVRRTTKEERLTPNIGQFIIFVCTADGKKWQLRFANQVSTVYYLMYLINRKQKEGVLPAIDLARNKSPFATLYHAVYDKISHDDAQCRHHHLLYRVVNGRIRAGRKAEIENDIRRHLAQAFAFTGDSPIPYGMSSHRNLAISPDLIVFQGEAHRLLNIQFI